MNVASGVWNDCKVMRGSPTKRCNGGARAVGSYIMEFLLVSFLLPEGNPTSCPLLRRGRVYVEDESGRGKISL